MIASSQSDALVQLEQRNFVPAVIISDYRLPGDVNGIDTINNNANNCTYLFLAF